MSTFVIGIDGNPITPTEISDTRHDENDGKLLVALFGRWYDSRRLEIRSDDDRGEHPQGSIA